MALRASMAPLFLLLLAFTSTIKPLSSSSHAQILSLRNPEFAEATQTCFPQRSRTEDRAAVLEIKRHDSSSSEQTLNSDKALQNRLIADEFRFNSIKNRIRNMVNGIEPSTPQSTEIPITPGIKLQTLNYIVTVKLGGKNFTVIVDTGSDLTWVQCQPCKQCYTQPEPFFNPSFSSSYQAVQCSSQSCRDFQYAIGNSVSCENDDPDCKYVVNYGDGSYTAGSLGQDTLVLGEASVDNFTFGCGYNNKGLFGAASGLMGLGKSDLSLASQALSLFDGVFSYCLPSADADNAHSGSLVLGNDSSVFRNTTPVSYTELAMNPQLGSFYILNLTGTSIGAVDLQSPSFGKCVIIIDSGTVITRLPPSIYTPLKNEFLKQFSGYPSAPGFSILDTCFNLAAYEEVEVPTMRMRFQGDAEMTVHVSGMLYFVKRDLSQVCLAVAGLANEDQVGIIGNYQQRNTRVVYDTRGSRVGFARELCRFS